VRQVDYTHDNKNYKSDDTINMTTCRLEYCDKPVKNLELCKSHYMQYWRDPNTKFWPIGESTSRKEPRRFRDENGNKRCDMCETFKDESCFTKSKKEVDGLARSCRECARNHRLTKHGFTNERFNELLKEQNNACAICLKTLAGTKIQIDHDHNHCPGKFGCNDCVRGLLCINCNTGLGLYKDSPVLLQNALDYLRKREPFEQ
jgi:hypothetical protein